MSTTSPAAGEEAGLGPARPDTRERISAAAFALFAAQGYDGTTVDAIAERAGVARRTFFRYFRSKDDVIFPDHDRLLDTVEGYLRGGSGLAPVEAVCGGVRLVFRSYVADPVLSVQRYRLTRSVTPLRDREIATVRRYERAFSRYLHERYSVGEGDVAASVHAAVVAAAVVSAHNAVLRAWLRAGGGYDPAPDLERAFAWVGETFERGGEPGPIGAEAAESDVVVAVFRADQPIDDVVERITRSL